MENILNKIKEVYQDCVNLKNELTGKLAQVTETEKQQKDLADKLTELQTSLILREEKVKAIEDLVKYREETEAISEKVKIVMADLQTRTTNFNNNIAEKNKEMQGIRESLEKREKELAEKETNLENIILEKIKAILKK